MYLKYTKALDSGDVPKADGFVHGSGKKKVVFGPGDVEEIRLVTAVFGERLGHEDALFPVFAEVETTQTGGFYAQTHLQLLHLLRQGGQAEWGQE